MAVVNYTLGPGTPHGQGGVAWSTVEEIITEMGDGWLRSSLDAKIKEILDLYPADDTATVRIQVINQGAPPPDTRP